MGEALEGVSVEVWMSGLAEPSSPHPLVQNPCPDPTAFPGTCAGLRK